MYDRLYLSQVEMGINGCRVQMEARRCVVINYSLCIDLSRQLSSKSFSRPAAGRIRLYSGLKSHQIENMKTFDLFAERLKKIR